MVEVLDGYVFRALAKVGEHGTARTAVTQAVLTQ